MTTANSILEDPNFRFKGLLAGKLYCLHAALSPNHKKFGVTLLQEHNGVTDYLILKNEEVVILTKKSLTVKGRYRIDLIYIDKFCYIEFDKNSEWDRCLKSIKPL